MTPQDVTRTEALAQESYQFVNQRFADYAAPVLALLHEVGIDRATFMRLEPVINEAINAAEHNGYVTGFMLSSAITPLPFFSTDPMDEVLRPDRYVAA
jgi:hypothetical protein